MITALIPGLCFSYFYALLNFYSLLDDSGYLELAFNCSFAILWKRRVHPGGRYMNFIHADGVHDVVITGGYGQEFASLF